MEQEHPIQQPISGIVVTEFDGGYEAYHVGRDGVTHIEACVKSGMHANIPYVRVWKGDVCVAEFCQHNIQGIYFDTSAARIAKVVEATASAGEAA